MPSMLLPLNQWDALPTAGGPSYPAEQGQVEVLPGVFQRYYSPADCGMNGLVGNASDPVTHRFRAYSTRMNVKGCKRFTFSLAVKMREFQNDSNFSCNVYATSWVEDGPGVTYSPLIDNFSASTWAQVGSLVMQAAYVAVPFPGPVLGVYPILYKTASCSWDVAGLANGSTQQDGTTGSIGIRLDGAAGIPGGAIYNAFLYGSLLAAS